jgi:transcriptional regulator GlxA family with amidase domain
LCPATSAAHTRIRTSTTREVTGHTDFHIHSTRTASTETGEEGRPGPSINETDILTASGSAAALDLGLLLVRRDHGAEIAGAVSRRLVFAAYRDGGQWQFVERTMPELADESLAPLLAWAQERIGEPLTVTGLAEHAAVSPAALHRRFRAQLGTTPLAWLTGERVRYACRLIERGEKRLDEVARRSGLGTAANLRIRLHRETGLSPSACRRRFGSAAGESVRV